ncbi:unnamed protein product [Closterium sp. NIES-53]
MTVGKVRGEQKWRGDQRREWQKERLELRRRSHDKPSMDLNSAPAHILCFPLLPNHIPSPLFLNQQRWSSSVGGWSWWGCKKVPFLISLASPPSSLPPTPAPTLPPPPTPSALEQQCRRMEAVGLRIDNIDLTCLDAEPAPHSPQSAQSPALALARPSTAGSRSAVFAATAGAPANGADGASESWPAPTGERKCEQWEAAEGQGVEDGTGIGSAEEHVRYAFSLVATPRGKRGEIPEPSDPEPPFSPPNGLHLPVRAPSLDRGADVAESEGSLDFASIFANGTPNRVTLPMDAPAPSVPPALVSAAGSTHKRGNGPPSPCAPVLLPGVIYSTNTECTPGSLGQGVPMPVQIMGNDISTNHSASMGQFSHGPTNHTPMHQSSFRSPHSSAHSSSYSSLSILPPTSYTDSYDHTLPSRSAIPSQASYSPTSSTLHSFASPACASPVSASPTCASPTAASPISATHAPPFPPTRPRPARQPAPGFHRRSSSLSVLTEYLPGVAPAACNSPCSSTTPAYAHPSTSTVSSRPSAEKPPTPRKAPVAPRFARSPQQPSAAVAGSGSPGLHHVQHMQHSQQVQMQQVEQVRPSRESLTSGRPRTPSMHRFTPSLPEISVADAVEEEGVGSEEGGDGSFSRSPVMVELLWRDGTGRHGALMQGRRHGMPGHAGRLGSPMQAERLGSPMQTGKLGSPTQAPRPRDMTQVRRFSPGGGGLTAGGSGKAGAEIKVWETSERGLLQGKGRSVSNRESGYRSMSSDNVLGGWSDIEADAEWVAVGGKQANAREVVEGNGGSPSPSSKGGIKGDTALHEDVRGGSVRGQEEGVRSTRSVLKKMLWRFKSGPTGQADESSSEKLEQQQQQQQQQEEEERQGGAEQEKRGGHTVRVFAVAEC